MQPAWIRRLHSHPAPYQNPRMPCGTEPGCPHLCLPAPALSCRVESTVVKLSGKIRDISFTLPKKSASSTCWSLLWLLPLSQVLNNHIYLGIWFPFPLLLVFNPSCLLQSRITAGSPPSLETHSERVTVNINNRQYCRPGFICIFLVWAICRQRWASRSLSPGRKHMAEWPQNGAPDSIFFPSA